MQTSFLSARLAAGRLLGDGCLPASLRYGLNLQHVRSIPARVLRNRAAKLVIQQKRWRSV